MLCDSRMDLAAPWPFRFGVPRPRQCSLPEGSGGVGRTRECQSDQGTIDQRIIEWEEPRRLCFVMERTDLFFRDCVNYISDTFDLEPTLSSGTRITAHDRGDCLRLPAAAESRCLPFRVESGTSLRLQELGCAGASGRQAELGSALHVLSGVVDANAGDSKMAGEGPTHWTAETNGNRFVLRAGSCAFLSTRKKLFEAQAQLMPYDGLASIWHDYASRFRYNYSAYVNYLAKENRLASWSALDLACGTGLHTYQLSACACDVVGLDASERMLEQARARYSESPAVRFVSGDFRDFHLGRRFDFAVCACNSMNYVRNLVELQVVLARVAEHLRPRGLFVFDTLTETGIKMLSGTYLHVKTGTMRFAIRFDYDPASRTDRAKVFLPWGTEVHFQTPDRFQRGC